MAELLLGPVVRNVGTTTATIWLETDRACSVEILGHAARTFRVKGHYYAFVEVGGLTLGADHPYTVSLDGRTVWPPASSRFPASTIRTWAPGHPFRLLAGSCQQAEPHEHPETGEERRDERAVGPDALHLWAHAMVAGDRPRPDALLLLGDQVYADETHPATEAVLNRRRGGPPRPGWPQVASFEEYTWLYHEAWSVPAMRWLLSCVPTMMLFDDHDVIDDWNTSAAWRREIVQMPWWKDRIHGALASYWVYQHLGNGSPREARDDELLALVRSAGDGAMELRAVAGDSDEHTPDEQAHQWSYRRDVGPCRIVAIDSRNRRVLDEGSRAMVGDEEWRWIERNVTGDIEHLVIATSLPWLLPRPIHDLEAWSERVAAGGWGRRAARAAEWLRQTLDLEHWAAFGNSFHALGNLLASVGRGERGRPPASILVLSGDVHFSLVAEPQFDGVRSTIRQIVSSPIRQAVSHVELHSQRLLSRRPMSLIPRALARSTPGAQPSFSWSVSDGPWFGNNIVLISFEGHAVRVEVDGVEGPEDQDAHLRPLLERDL